MCLLHPVLAEHALAGVEERAEGVLIKGLRHRDQGHGIGGRAEALAGSLDPIADGLEPLGCIWHWLGHENPAFS